VAAREILEWWLVVVVEGRKKVEFAAGEARYVWAEPSEVRLAGLSGW
jgi:hypothetical protein